MHMIRTVQPYEQMCGMGCSRGQRLDCCVRGWSTNGMPMLVCCLCHNLSPPKAASVAYSLCPNLQPLKQHPSHSAFAPTCHRPSSIRRMQPLLRMLASCAPSDPSLCVGHLLVLGLLGRHLRLLGPLIVSQSSQIPQPLSRSRSPCLRVGALSAWSSPAAPACPPRGLRGPPR